MKTLVIYTSQTGFTKRYSEWLGERLAADVMDLKEAQKKEAGFFNDYEAICYGGWLMAGSVAKVKWFLSRAEAWKGKRLAVFCVGGSPNDSSDAERTMEKLLSEEQRQYIGAFYCQGGINYEKMNAASRMTLKMFTSALKKKKNISPEQKAFAEMISSTYDISDRKYIEPIAEYLEGERKG